MYRRGFTNMEQIMWTVVDNCPNRGSGPCDFVHTCVDYETGDDGIVRPIEKKEG